MTKDWYIGILVFPSTASVAENLDFTSLLWGNKLPRLALCFSLPTVSLLPALKVAATGLACPPWFSALTGSTDRSWGVIMLVCICLNHS